MKNILLTGVSGYLGSRLVERLSKREDIGDMVGIDIKNPAELPDGVSFYAGDIRDPSINDVLVKHAIDTVFHLAFVVKPIHNTQRMHDIDVNGTNNILEAAHRSGVRHVIAISSTLAYGAHPDNPKQLTEDAPLRGNKIFPYGYYKAVTDKLIQDFARNHPEMTVSILRPCTVFGPTVDNYVSRMLFLPATVCVKGYDPPVQFVHEDDFVEACLLAMDQQKTGAFNITGNGTITVKEIAHALGARVIPVPAWLLYPTLECLWRLHFPKIEVNRGYLDYIRYPFVASNKKAKELLGFDPKYTSAQTLEETIRSKTNAQARPKR
ncbi:MAG: SDR family oxidoreductase [Desulfobacterales bacterium]|nr:SDR family oxidoreductase [Desulfobacterales bacterium]